MKNSLKKALSGVLEGGEKQGEEGGRRKKPGREREEGYCQRERRTTWQGEPLKGEEAHQIGVRKKRPSPSPCLEKPSNRNKNEDSLYLGEYQAERPSEKKKWK